MKIFARCAGKRATTSGRSRSRQQSTLQDGTSRHQNKMPKYIEVNSGPHKKLKFIGHDDAEAYDKQAGEVGACVETADLSDVYRSLLPSAHDEFVKVLDKNTLGVKRGVNEEATKKAKAKAKDGANVSDVPEAYVTYANRVKASLEAVGPDGVAEWKRLDDEIHAIAEKMACDSSPTARQKGPDKGALNKADDILADTEPSREARITKLLNAVEGYDLERDDAGLPDRVSLARLVQEYVKASI